jgi:dolichol-phosphate mannosyltransferase
MGCARFVIICNCDTLGTLSAQAFHLKGVVLFRRRPVISTAHPDITVVLPTFNEAGNIPVIVERIVAALGATPCEIIVVDDNSADGTAQIARKLGEERPYLRCIRRVGRRGLSGACVEGMMAASAPVVAIMDADLQHDETVLPKMLDEIRSGADLVVATRYNGEGSAEEGFSRTRAWGSRLATTLANRITGEMVSDPMSGFFMLRRDLADRIAGQVAQQGFKILFDILSRVGPQTVIREVPFTFRERHSGDSKLDALVTVQFLGLLVSRFTGGLVPGQFLLFGMVGVTGIFVHMAALYGLTGLAGLQFAWAQAGATLIAMTSNFIINNNLTYAHRKLRGSRWIVGLLSFYAVCSLGAIANVSVASHIYSWQTSVGVAGLAGALMSAVFNYSVTKLVTWRDV